MTQKQCQLYISQIGWVSTGERIKGYLRAIYGILLKLFCDTDLSPELDEDETQEDRKEKELREIQKLADKYNIPKPER